MSSQAKDFHAVSKNARRQGRLPESAWPKAWKTTYYKSYPRLPRIGLSVGTLEADFSKTALARKSGRTFSEAPLSIEELGTLLHHSLRSHARGTDLRRHRPYPSAGARYPLEAYLVIPRSGGERGAPAGLFHYHPGDHALEILLEREFSEDDLRQLISYDWALKAPAFIVLSAVFFRTEHKYGERGYRAVLMEAGHAAQSLNLAATALGLNSCNLIGFVDTEIENLLEIDGVTESALYVIALGKPQRE